MSFTLPLDEARAINVAGTRRMLEFAELAHARGGLNRYAHVSTAYVAGTHPGRFAECDLDLGQAFHNSYEHSKFEAERLVAEHPGLPATVLRPSIIVGDQRSGWTSAFNVLYWPLRAFARGLFTAVPAIPSAPVDVVSVDYVADAIHALCEAEGGIGATYHLTAGPNASTMGEIAALASRYFRRPLPQVLPPAEFAALAHGDGRAHGAGRRPRVLPVLLDRHRLRTGGDPRAPGASGDPGGAAERVPGAPAGLRDSQPVGQAPDRARGRGTGLGPPPRSGPGAAPRSGYPSPHPGGRSPQSACRAAVR